MQLNMPSEGSKGSPKSGLPKASWALMPKGNPRCMEISFCKRQTKLLAWANDLNGQGHRSLQGGSRKGGGRCRGSTPRIHATGPTMETPDHGPLDYGSRQSHGHQEPQVPGSQPTGNTELLPWPSARPITMPPSPVAKLTAGPELQRQGQPEQMRDRGNPKRMSLGKTSPLIDRQEDKRPCGH